ncbi:retrovirus-related Pol polyprotein from transposon TNT 1-94, partial [Trifolium pratense]
MHGYFFSPDARFPGDLIPLLGRKVWKKGNIDSSVLSNVAACGAIFREYLGNSLQKFQLIKSVLDSLFKIKDMGILKYFLGLEVAHSKIGISISSSE